MMEHWMPASDTLALIGGSPADQEFSFSERSTSIADRWTSAIRIVEEGRKIVSRTTACSTSPVDVRVRDFGSLNGTFCTAVTYPARSRHRATPGRLPADTEASHARISSRNADRQLVRRHGRCRPPR